VVPTGSIDVRNYGRGHIDGVCLGGFSVEVSDSYKRKRRSTRTMLDLRVKLRQNFC
jgi:hypothetical protein